MKEVFNCQNHFLRGGRVGTRLIGGAISIGSSAVGMADSLANSSNSSSGWLTSDGTGEGERSMGTDG